MTATKPFSIALCYPRPRKGTHRYSGGFTAGFERKLLRILGSILQGKGPLGSDVSPPFSILHPFGGRAEYGLRCDIQTHTYDSIQKMDIPIAPDVVADAHKLPFADNMFDTVILDPPFSPEFAKTKWNTKPPKFKIYSAEAARVCREGGLVVMYHWYALPAIVNTIFLGRVLIEGRLNAFCRVCHIRQKDTDVYRLIGERIALRKRRYWLRRIGLL